jgi:hypothetical protein
MTKEQEIKETLGIHIWFYGKFDIQDGWKFCNRHNNENSYIRICRICLKIQAYEYWGRRRGWVDFTAGEHWERGLLQDFSIYILSLPES